MLEISPIGGSWYHQIPHEKAQLLNVGHSAANKPQEAGRPEGAPGQQRALRSWPLKVEGYLIWLYTPKTLALGRLR